MSELEKASLDEPMFNCPRCGHCCPQAREPEQPAQQEIDWKDQYEKQKRRAEMWIAKYEADIGPVERAGPVAAQQEPFGHGGRPMTLRECMEAEEPSQAEPVAWATQLGEYAHIQWGAKRPEYPMVYEFPLYTRPQAREWVGLSDEEVAQGNKESWVTEQAWQSAVWWADAKLKEKNT